MQLKYDLYTPIKWDELSTELAQKKKKKLLQDQIIVIAAST